MTPEEHAAELNERARLAAAAERLAGAFERIAAAIERAIEHALAAE